LLYCLGDQPVAMLDLERYENSTASFALVVSPTHRRSGLATSILRDLFALTETAGIAAVFGGVERGNQASERCAKAAGFEATVDARETGFVRYTLRRAPSTLGDIREH
jgi:L-amino acid N-acyltransferase YncA